MTAELHDIAAKLRHDWCDTFEAWVDRNHVVVSSALEFRDGDSIPVFITHRQDSWVLSDQGAVMASFPASADYELTESRLESIREYLRTHRCVLQRDGQIVRTLRRRPGAAQIADFLRLLVGVYAAPELLQRDAAEPFKQRMVEAVRARLDRTIAPLAVPRWPVPGAEENKCDLWLPSEPTGREEGVATFFVASPGGPVLNAAVFTYALKDVGRSDQVVVGYDDARIRRDSSEMRRLRSAGDVTIVGIPPSGIEDSTFEETLRRHGVALAG